LTTHFFERSLLCALFYVFCTFLQHLSLKFITPRLGVSFLTFSFAHSYTG
jgi:hypothetical protein